MVHAPRQPLTSSLTSKGQVTIPVYIRRLLRLSTRDRVAFGVNECKVQIAPPPSGVGPNAGMLRGNTEALSPSEESAAIEQAMAEEAEQPR